MHLHLASHLGMLDEALGEPKDVMLEPNPKMIFGGPIPKMEGPLECMPRVKMFPKTVQANWTDFVLDPRQASEHSKSPTLSFY